MMFPFTISTTLKPFKNCNTKLLGEKNSIIISNISIHFTIKNVVFINVSDDSQKLNYMHTFFAYLEKKCSSLYFRITILCLS